MMNLSTAKHVGPLPCRCQCYRATAAQVSLHIEILDQGRARPPWRGISMGYHVYIYIHIHIFTFTYIYELYYIILYFTISYYIILYYFMLYYGGLYGIIL